MNKQQIIIICPEENKSFINLELKLESKFQSKGGVSSNTV